MVESEHIYVHAHTQIHMCPVAVGIQVGQYLLIPESLTVYLHVRKDSSF